MWSKLLECMARAALAVVAMLLAMDGAFCQTAKSRNEIYSRAIPFQSADRLDDYSVSGLWFPEGLIPFGGLSGPAVFVIKNVNSGKQRTIAVNAIALLDKDFWDKHHVANAEQLEPETLVEKLAGFGVASISLSQDKRAKVVSCERATNDPYPPKARADRCLQLGDAVVDLQDVDFDGKKELVFKHAGMGQRSGPAYEIVRIPENDNDVLERAGDAREPFRDLDWRTVLNITRKQIMIQGSNGACSDDEETYSRGASGEMSMTHFWRRVALHTPDDCVIEDYAVESQGDGIGRRLKLLSRRKAE